jgi:hypothetical protein
MSSMENGRTHCGFRSIRRTTAWGQRPQGSCPLVYQRPGKKASGSMYDDQSATGDRSQHPA